MKIWMDSGGFTAYTVGEKQDLKAYCAWLRRNAATIDHYAVLDNITSPSETWENQQRMEAEGMHPVPCFHYGEPVEWLHRYLDAGHQYIALGGMVPISSAQLLPWLDGLFGDHLCNRDGAPRVRVHGFGLTTFELVDRYPWFSVDSSSWIQSARFGLVLLYHGGELFRVNISEQSSKTGEKGSHYLTETPSNQARIRELFETTGHTWDSLMKDYKMRRSQNAASYLAYAKAWKARPFVRPVGLLDFGTPNQHTEVAKGWPWPELEMYLAGDVLFEDEHRLLKRDANRMFSYHYFKSKVGGTKNVWKLYTAVKAGRPAPTRT